MVEVEMTMLEVEMTTDSGRKDHTYICRNDHARGRNDHTGSDRNGHTGNDKIDQY